MLANEVFGWTWIGLGMLSGALLGLGFHKDHFLGGYASWTRRLLRLGHVSFFALGALNVLFASVAMRLDLTGNLMDGASIAFIAGGVLMPACCALAAFLPRARHLFAAPVLALIAGAGATTLAIAQHGGVL